MGSRSAVLTAGSLAANALGYVLTLVAARRLGPADYGTFAVLLGLLVTGNVVALGVQATTARHIALAPTDTRLLVTLGTRASLAAGAAGLLLALPAVWFLHLGSVAGPVAVALTLVPLTWNGLQQGWAQGQHRHGTLALLVLGSAVGRTAGALVGVLIGSPAAAAIGMGVGTLVVAVAAIRWVPLRPSLSGGSNALVMETVHATHTLFAFFALANADLLLARHYLPAETAGSYAVGSAIAKIAFWLPASVGLVAFPDLVDRSRRTATLRAAFTLLAGVGAGVVLGSALLGNRLVDAVGGAGYQQLEGSAWVFAAIGTALALTQLTLLDRLAQEDRSAVITVWAAVIALIVVVSTLTHESLEAIAATMLAVVCGVAVTGVLLGPLGAERAIGYLTRGSGQTLGWNAGA